ncbi:hypothetical protein, partial [Pseudomonas coronafaciens]|uniref:hypothetical protein n=1 Tax=Pseudomonas coronafaciens TaxID=53409 RepID=UPI001C10B957
FAKAVHLCSSKPLLWLNRFKARVCGRDGWCVAIELSILQNAASAYHCNTKYLAKRHRYA